MTRTQDMIAAIQAIHLTIPGIDSAPVAYPTQINDNDLPLVLVFPTQVTFERLTLGSKNRQDRTFHVQVFVKATAQSKLDTSLQACMVLEDAFMDAYLNPANPTLIDGFTQAIFQVSQPQNFRGSGPVVLNWAGSDYHGLDLTIQVFETW